MTPSRPGTWPDLPVIDDPVAVDVITDPVRFRIYRQVTTPKSVRELASEPQTAEPGRVLTQGR